MTSAIRDVEIRHRGDRQGNSMVVMLTTNRGKPVHAISVPQDSASRTGPTWVYLVEADGLTMIDAGSAGSFDLLSQGVERAGFRLQDVERVIVTHGHADHDGSVYRLAAETGAEVWAHEVYPHLLHYDPWELQGIGSSPVQQELRSMAVALWGDRRHPPGRHHAESRYVRHRMYLESRRSVKVAHPIVEGEQAGDLVFIYAPGHSPDEICISLDGVVFTGDHVLPEITPHPTVKGDFPELVKRRLGEAYRRGEDHYGLGAYLKSLKKVQGLGKDTAVLPAHRLFNRNRFNLLTTTRAGDTLRHHVHRLHRIVARIGHVPRTLVEVTSGIFQREKLVGGNLYAALSEVVSHIEFLVDSGDVELTPEGRVRWRGTENFRQVISDLKP